MHGLGMAHEHRHANRGCIDPDRLVLEDLLGLPKHLHLFFRVAVVEEHVDLRHAVVSNLLRNDLGNHGMACCKPCSLLRQFVHCLLAAARHRLVSRDIDALDACGIMQRLERDQHLHRRAVRVRNDVVPLVACEGVRVHFRDYERNVVLVAELRSVVDHDATGLAGFGRVLRRNGRPGRKQANLRPREIEGRNIEHRVVTTGKLDGLTDGTRTGEGIQVIYREFPLFQDGEHRAAHQPRRSHHCHIPTLAHRSATACRKVEVNSNCANTTSKGRHR